MEKAHTAEINVASSATRQATAGWSKPDASISMVGIVYLVGGKLWIDATPISRAWTIGDFSFHRRDYSHHWKQLVKRGAAPDAEYGEYPRSRVSDNRKSGQFSLIADRCNLRKQKFVNAILSQMYLPVRNTETDTDSGYRCSACLRRNR